jgi:predicted enzyme related to lactoylglutathione lyase
MSKFKGRFVWHELITTDPEGAKAFYSKVVGWTTEDITMPGMTYTLGKADGVQVVGMMAIPPQAAAMNVPPNWTGYIAVADVDASAAQVKSLGGKVFKEPMDIPNVGRFAIVTDPQGAFFALFRGEGDGEMDPGQMTPGHVGWNELYAGDVSAVFPFYETMFGWKKLTALEMGAMGVYQLYGFEDPAMGGMMTRPPQVPVPCWLYYFNVGQIDEAVERVKAAGGQVINGPMEVPGPMWVIQALDPQGAMFALVGTR